MTFLKDMLNPPSTDQNRKNANYDFSNNVYECINSMTYIPSPSIVMNANFNFLSGKGLTPTTQADGDDVEFIGDWKVFGASDATYTLSPLVYPASSTVKSSSEHYFNASITSLTNGGLYIYQRQLATVRKYQKEYFTYGLIIKNNSDKDVSIITSIYSYYDTGESLKNATTIYLKPGLNQIPSSVELTESLADKTVGAANYTEFRIRFLDIFDSVANLDFYQVKCEFGKISTPLQ